VDVLYCSIRDPERRATPPPGSLRQGSSSASGALSCRSTCSAFREPVDSPARSGLERLLPILVPSPVLFRAKTSPLLLLAMPRSFWAPVMRPSGMCCSSRVVELELTASRSCPDRGSVNDRRDRSAGILRVGRLLCSASTFVVQPLAFLPQRAPPVPMRQALLTESVLRLSLTDEAGQLRRPAAQAAGQAS